MSALNSVLAIGCVLVLMATTATKAQERISKCSDLEVLSIAVKPQSGVNLRAANSVPTVMVLTRSWLAQQRGFDSPRLTLARSTITGRSCKIYSGDP